MIKIKLQKSKNKEPILKLGIKDKDLDSYKFLKRSLMDGKKTKGIYNYEVPLRYFIPIFNNIDKENLIIDKNSILTYLEFSDDFDEKYYYTLILDVKYMKSWRMENCPNIYRISIKLDDLTIEKEVAFKKVKLNISI